MTTLALKPRNRNISPNRVSQVGSPRGHTRIPCPPQVVFSTASCTTGLDFLKVSLWLDWSSRDFLSDLHSRKRSVQETDDIESPFRVPGGLSFNLQRTGAGKYNYVLKSGDITLMFSNHKADAPFPNCRIEIGSVSCWEPGWEYIFYRLCSWLKIYGASIKQEKISEFHITADLLDVDFTETGFDDRFQWITRSNKWKVEGEFDDSNYIAFGKGDMMLRVYDKTAEIKRNGAKSAIFHSIWRKQINRTPEHVTRIEYQMRRPVFKEFQINTVADLRRNQNSVWQYCVSQWSRFCSDKVDRKNKNHQRSATAFIWSVVQALKFKKGRIYKLVRKKVLLSNIDSLKKQAAGCLLSVCAALGQDHDDFIGHITTAFSLVDEQIRENFKDFTGYVRNMEVKLNYAYAGI